MKKENRTYSRLFEPPLPVQQYLYETTIKPHLKVTPNPLHYSYLMSKAIAVMVLSIDKYEINRMLFVNWIAEQLYEKDEAFLIKALSEILQETHDTDKRSEIAENNLRLARDSKDNESHISELIRVYKVLFENEFRLWATLPFGFVSSLSNIKLPDSERSNYALISASKKYHAIMEVKIATIFGSFTDLLAGFDNDIRNSGEGHDSWEISDNGSILFKIINPDTGGAKGRKEIEIKVTELDDLLNTCRRTLWSLEVGTVIFLINNPNIMAKLERSKAYKLKEIERSVQVFAEERGFYLAEFSISEDRSEIFAVLKYDPIDSGHGGQLFIGKKAAFDLVKINLKGKLVYQVLGILQMLVKCHFDKGTVQLLKVRLLDKNDAQIGYAEYVNAEIQKLYEKTCNENIPTAQIGEIPDIEIDMAVQLKVRYGTGKQFEKYLATLPKNEIEKIAGLNKNYD
jgi:hypothetical protein